MMDESSPDDASSEDETQDPQMNLKKRKRVTKHQSRRAKPLTVEILHQIFETLNIFKDPVNGTYKLILPMLKSAECSSKYFAVTEWQCFRKRIMNHGFEIVDEQQSSWIRVRPNLATAEGLLVFEDAELRRRFSTPCKIKSARERGEIFELPASDPEEFENMSDYEEHSASASETTSLAVPTSPNSSSSSSQMSLSAMSSPTALPPLSASIGVLPTSSGTSAFASALVSARELSSRSTLPVLPAFAALRAELEQDHQETSRSSVDLTPEPQSEVQLEGALRSCMPLSLVVRELLSSGHFSHSNGQFDIQVTMRQSGLPLPSSSRPPESFFPRFSALKSETSSAAKAPLA